MQPSLPWSACSPWSACGEAPRALPARKTPVVVALHASASSARQWRALAERIEPQWRVLAVDLHEHGVMPPWSTVGAPRPPLTLEDEAALVAPQLADAGRVAEGGGVHLVGHSYGGVVALKVASQHPQYVRSLALYEPVAFRLLLDDPASHAETHEALTVAEAMQSRIERDDFEGAAQRFVDYWSGSGTWEALSPDARERVARQMPVVLQHFGALFNERRQVQAAQRLHQPVLLLSGERTTATVRRIVQRLQTLVSHAAHETLPGMGHMGPITHAGLVNERLAAFLQAVSDRAAAPQSGTTAAAARPPFDRLPYAFPSPLQLTPRDLLTID
jgi:pimeloyl-ACP methyl ester carboxylesterase